MAEPTLVDSHTSPYFCTTPKRLPPRIGRPKGSKDKLQADAKWIVNEAVRLNGGLEWVTAWMKKNPDLAIPMWCRAMVPKAIEGAQGSGIRVVIYSQPATSMTQVSEAIDLSSTSTPQPVVTGTAPTEDSETDRE